MEGEIKVGTHIILLKNRKILLGERGKQLGIGQWELPGGHLEFKESLEECLERECREELGIEVNVGKLVSVAPNYLFGNHYLIFTFLAESFSGEPQLREPKKHQQWEWFELDRLPKKLFVSTRVALGDYLTGKIYQKRPKQA